MHGAFLLCVAILLGSGCDEASLGEGADRETASVAEARLRSILAMPSVVDRAAALAELLGSLGPDSVESVERALDPARGRLDELSGMLIFSWWAGFDPETAYRRSQEPRSGDRQLWERVVVEEWARRDPLAALAIAKAIPVADQDRVLGAVRGLSRGWLATDASPADLIAWIESLPLGRLRNEALTRFVNAMADARGLDATIAFVEGLPAGDGNFKLQVFRRLATAIAHRDPQRALAWAAKHAGGPYDRNLLRRIGARWGWVQGEPAMEWARGLPEGEARAGIVRETYRGFRLRSRDRADAWIARQEPTVALEPAYVLYLVGITGRDPRTALQLIEEVEDAQLRGRLLVSVVRRWRQSDAEAAEAWLQAADLAPEIERSIRDPRAEPS